jgi:hypothetical protein
MGLSGEFRTICIGPVCLAAATNCDHKPESIDSETFISNVGSVDVAFLCLLQRLTYNLGLATRFESKYSM